MKVRLFFATPLSLVAFGVRMSRDTLSKSETLSYTCRCCNEKTKIEDFFYQYRFKCSVCGCKETLKELPIDRKDFELIDRVGNKLKHSSVLEHAVVSFHIDGISRAVLQQLSRHRTASLTVKSTRYTLKELKKEEAFMPKSFGDDETYRRASKYVVLTDDEEVNRMIVLNLENLRTLIVRGKSNDLAKYALPEAFKTKLQFTIDVRNLSNFFNLRSHKDALWEMRRLAYEMYKVLPQNYQELLRDYMHYSPNEEEEVNKIPAYHALITAGV